MQALATASPMETGHPKPHEALVEAETQKTAPKRVANELILTHLRVLIQQQRPGSLPIYGRGFWIHGEQRSEQWKHEHQRRKSAAKTWKHESSVCTKTNDFSISKR